ncbi:MAG: hypothetical protein M5T61_08420 [Acidimicrobiia bacterium]|nr:hypothetical protein [Acidimicrobiia bacterium]
MKLSISVPDDLWTSVAREGEAPSHTVQRALRETASRSATAEVDFSGLPRSVRDALVAACEDNAREAHELENIAVELAVVCSRLLPWRRLDAYAGAVHPGAFLRDELVKLALEDVDPLSKLYVDDDAVGRRVDDTDEEQGVGARVSDLHLAEELPLAALSEEEEREYGPWLSQLVSRMAGGRPIDCGDYDEQVQAAHLIAARQNSGLTATELIRLNRLTRGDADGDEDEGVDDDVRLEQAMQRSADERDQMLKSALEDIEHRRRTGERFSSHPWGTLRGMLDDVGMILDLLSVLEVGPTFAAAFDKAMYAIRDRVRAAIAVRGEEPS